MTKYMLVISEEQRLRLNHALAFAESQTKDSAERDAYVELFEMLYELPDVEKQAPGIIHDLTA